MISSLQYKNVILFKVKKVINQIVNQVEKANKILIIGHENPDGDAIGSVLGLFHVLKKMSKKVFAIFPDDAPEYLMWMPSYNESLIYEKDRKKVEELFKQTDLIFCLDFNQRSRVEHMENILSENKSVKIVIDHHPYPDSFFDIIISDQNVSSTAELLYSVIEACGWKSYLSKESAECLFTGIVTDTISFNVNSSNYKTYEVVAELLKFNIDKEKIYRRVFNSFTESRLKMLGYALYKKMKILSDYATAYIWLSKEELKQFSFQKGDTEWFVNYPLMLKGIKFSAIFYERDNYIKISFRSRGNIPVNEIMSKHFLGGGHKNAAGGKEKQLTLDETIQKFESILPLYKDILCNEDM